MAIIKRYFLYGLMINSFCLFAMENNPRICVENLRNIIDEKYLGIDRNTWFRGIIGSVLSFYCSSGLTKQQVEDEMRTIESSIPLEDKELVLKKLAERHWYVNYLIQKLVSAKIEELQKVRGSTIDVLYNPTGENSLKNMVHEESLETFFYDSGIKNSVENIPMGQLGDIHYIVLYGHTRAIDPPSLIMSSDGKYLQSTDDNNNYIVWDMKQGVKVDPLDIESQSITWKSGYIPDHMKKYYVIIDKTRTYYATSSNSGVGIGENYPPRSLFYVGPSNIPVKIKRDKPAIILFKLPQKISYFCQEAFNNSVYSQAELTALCQSESINKIEGYPLNNLKRRIEKRQVFNKRLSDEKTV